MRKSLKSLSKLLKIFIIFNLIFTQSLPILANFIPNAYADSETILTDSDATYTPSGWNVVASRGYDGGDGTVDPTDTVHDANWTGGVGDNATWTLSSISAGWYTVYVSWVTNSNRSTMAQYNVNGLETSSSLVNQQLLNDQTTAGADGQWSGWYSLGTHQLNTSSSIVLIKTDDGYLSADEIRLVKDETAPSTPSNVEVTTDSGISTKVYDNGFTKDNTPKLVWSNSSDSGSPVVYNYMANGTQYGTNLINTFIQAGATPDGTYLWQAQACDLAGNCSGWSTAWSLTVDTVSPIITITSPTITSDSTPTITGTVTDLNIDSVSVNVDGNNYLATISGTDYSADVIATLSDGVYVVTATATDKAGNSSSTTSSLTVDATIPYVYAGADRFTNSSISITDATFDAGIIGLDSFNWTSTDGTLSDWSSPSDYYPTFSATTDGIYTLTFEVTDLLGQTNSDSVQIVWDTIFPLVELTNLTDGQHVKGLVDIKGAIEDQNLYRYYFVIQNSGGTTVGGLNTVYDDGPKVDLSYDWNTSTLPDGEYTIKLEARDKAGNKDATISVKWIKVIVDNTSPIAGSVTVETDYEGAYVRGKNTGGDVNRFSIYMPVSDLNLDTKSCEYTLDNGSTWTPANYDSVGEKCYIEYLSGLDYTTVNINMRACDLAGNCTDGTSIDRLIDSKNPTVTTPVITPVVNGYTAKVFQVSSTGTDSASGIKLCRIQYQINGTAGTWTNIPTSWDGLNCAGTVDLTGIINNDDLVYVRTRVRDRVDFYSAWQQTSIKIDTQIPYTYFTYDYSNGYFNNDIFIKGTSEDNSGIDKVYIFIKESASTDWPTDPTFTFDYAETPTKLDWDTWWGPQFEGVYDIKALAEDSFGNIETTAYMTNLNFDYTDPTVEIITPQKKGYVKGNYTFSGKATDNFNLRRVAIRIIDIDDNDQNGINENILVCADVNNVIGLGNNWTISCDYNTLQLVDGRYRVLIRAYDMAGNEFNTYYNFFVDNTSPTIDTTDDIVLNEGDMLNLGFLDGKSMRDNLKLDTAHVEVTYSGRLGDANYTNDFDISMAGCGYDGCGLGGTLNELIDYETEEYITFGDYSLPIDTSLLQEGTYSFNYYVMDMAGNRSDCDVETEGYQNCEFSITINNVTPEVTFSADQTIYEGDIASFTASFTDPSTLSLPWYLYEMGLFDDLLADEGMTIDDVITELENLLESGSMDPSAEDLLYSILHGDDSPWYATINYGLGAGDVFLGQFVTPGDITIPNMPYTHERIYTVTLNVCEATTENNMFSENTCTTKTVTVTVNNLAPTVNTTATPSANVVEGTPMTLTANVFSGNAPYTYLWSGDCSGTNPTYSLTEAQYRVAGSYTCKVTVTDVDGDIAEREITISTSENLPSVIIYSNQTNSNGTVISSIADILLTSVVLGGNQPYTYQWGGICGGTAPTTTVSLSPGSYYCRVDITDNDGDIASAGVTIVINELGNLVGPNNNINNNTTEEGSEEEEGEVLGTETQRCETKQKVSGYVYKDSNNNQKKDEGEDTFQDIEVTLTYTYEGREYSTDTETDENGYWEIELCPGSYNVKVDSDDIPEGHVLGEEQEITLNADNELSDINLGLVNESEEKNKSKLWWLLLIPVSILAIGGIVATLTKKSKDE